MAKRVKASVDPTFGRGDVARILNVTPLTIANRERRGQYPAPKRDLNNYRVYTLNDVFNMQLITFGSVDPRPIVSLLYDKGYHNPKDTVQLIDQALARRKGVAT